jgi:hypothetical protein
MKTRHTRTNRCPFCNSATFRVETGFTKPAFFCDNNCSTWSAGRDGEPYLKNARNYEAGRLYVGYRWDEKGNFIPTGEGLYDKKQRWIGPG